MLIGGQWFTVAGILSPLPLAPEIDRSALVGFPVTIAAVAGLYPATRAARLSPTEALRTT